MQTPWKVTWKCLQNLHMHLSLNRSSDIYFWHFYAKVMPGENTKSNSQGPCVVPVTMTSDKKESHIPHEETH